MTTRASQGVARSAEFWRRFHLNKRLKAEGKPLVPLESSGSSTAAERKRERAEEEARLFGHLPAASYRDDPDTRYAVHYTKSAVEADHLIGKLRGKVVGFDAEWKVAFRQPQRPTALVQICDDRSILLLHLIHMNSLPDGLRTLLQDEQVHKTGLYVSGDARRLDGEYDMRTRGLVELGTNARRLMPERITPSRPTLAWLTGELMQRSLDKGPVRVSNWEVSQLTEEQQDYAATDAYVSYKLYQIIEAQGGPLTVQPDSAARKQSRSSSSKRAAANDLMPTLLESAEQIVLSNLNKPT